MRRPVESASEAGRAAALARLSTAPGQCASCRHLELIESSRSIFVRCGLARDDPRFARYPRLPVRECPGYRREG